MLQVLDTVAQWLSLANIALQMVGLVYVLVLQLRPMQDVIRPKIAGMMKAVADRASSAVRSRRMSGRLPEQAAGAAAGEAKRRHRVGKHEQSDQALLSRCIW